MKLRKIPQKIVKYCRIFAAKADKIQVKKRTSSMAPILIIILWSFPLALCSAFIGLHFIPKATYSIEIGEEIPYSFNVEFAGKSYPIKEVELFKEKIAHLNGWYIKYDPRSILGPGPLGLYNGTIELYRFVNLIPPDTEKLKLSFNISCTKGKGYVNIKFNDKVVESFEIAEGEAYTVKLNISPSQIYPPNFTSDCKMSVLINNPYQKLLSVDVSDASLKAYPKSGKSFFPVNFTFLDIHGYERPPTHIRSPCIDNFYIVYIEGVKIDENLTLRFAISSRSIPWYKSYLKQVFLTRGTYNLSFKLVFWDNRTINLGNCTLNVDENGPGEVRIRLPLYHLIIDIDNVKFLLNKTAIITYIDVIDTRNETELYRGLYYRRGIVGGYPLPYPSAFKISFFPLPPGSYLVKIESFDSFTPYLEYIVNVNIVNADVSVKVRFFAIYVFQIILSLQSLVYLSIVIGYIAFTSLVIIRENFREIRESGFYRRPLIFSIFLSIASIVAPWAKYEYVYMWLEFSPDKIVPTRMVISYFHFPILMIRDMDIVLKENVNYNVWVFYPNVDPPSLILVVLFFWIPFIILLRQLFKPVLKVSVKKIIIASILILSFTTFFIVGIIFSSTVEENLSLCIGSFLQLFASIFGFIDALYIKRVKSAFITTISSTLNNSRPT